MAILNFRRSTGGTDLSGLARGFSIEVMPRTAAKVEDFRTLLPAGTRVYIAHIEGTPFEEMLATARRISDEGFTPMPHMPARMMESLAQFESWARAYAEEAGVREALVLAGGPATLRGPLHSSMQLLESGIFDRLGYRRLHVAGHPEGNRDIDPDGGTRLSDEAARWKHAFAERTDADMAMVTQFAFAAEPVTRWMARLAAIGVSLPVWPGIAGPAKLQTLLKFALACGVGPSLGVLKKRARDVTKLLLPYEPSELLEDLAARLAAGEGAAFAGLHVFPLGGIQTAADYMRRLSGGSQTVSA